MNFIDEIFEILKLRTEQKFDNFCCDVIIPVYNAYSDLIKCLYSVLKYQNGYRIILINDNSTDPLISELFSKIKHF